MNQITIFIICILFALGLMYQCLRSGYLKSLNKALLQSNFERVQEILDQPKAKLLLSKYNRDLYQARIYYLSKDETKLIAHLRDMMNKSYEKADTEQYLTLYYHTFVNENNREWALELLEQIHKLENDKLIRCCDWTKRVLLDECNELVDEITAALDNKDYYGFPLGTCAYLIGVQKKRLAAYEEAMQWFDAAKDVFQKRDIYRPVILKELEALKEMGYAMPEKPQRVNKLRK